MLLPILWSSACFFTLSENHRFEKDCIYSPNHFTDWINDVSRLIGINQKIIDITLENLKKIII